MSENLWLGMHLDWLINAVKELRDDTLQNPYLNSKNLPAEGKIVNNQLKESKKTMDNTAKELVRRYIADHLDKPNLDRAKETPVYEVYTVWKCKVLQNWKYLCASTLPDGMYYELTYDGDRNRWYLDAYKKFESQCLTVGKIM